MKHQKKIIALLLWAVVMTLAVCAAHADLFPGLSTPTAAPAPTPTATKSSLFTLPGLPDDGPRLATWANISPDAEREQDQVKISAFSKVSQITVLEYCEYLEMYGYQLIFQNTSEFVENFKRIYRSGEYYVILTNPYGSPLQMILMEAVARVDLSLDAVEKTLAAVQEDMRSECAAIVPTPTPTSTPKPTQDPEDPTCPYCGGTGWCSHCIGGECPHCDGEGSDMCTALHCLGGICLDCGGYGYTLRLIGGEIKEMKCNYCNGKGICSRCGGTGEIKCRYCNGSGDCSYCHGTDICQYCHGTGER